MSKKGGVIFPFKDSDGNQMFNVVFGRNLKDGHFQVSPSVKSKTYKSKVAALKAISKYQATE